MSLQIKIQRPATSKSPSVITVCLEGSLNTETSPELERQLAVVLADPVKDVVFDLAELKFISSAGLRTFGGVRKTLKDRGGQASFVNLQSQIKVVFEVIKSLPGVSIYQDTAALDRYLALLQSEQSADSR